MRHYLLVSLILLSGCSLSREHAGMYEQRSGAHMAGRHISEQQSEQAAVFGQAHDKIEESAESSGEQKNGQAALRLVITTARIEVEVLAIPKAQEQIEVSVKKHGGYIELQHNQSICVRIPSRNFASALKKLERLGKVTSKHIDRTDVTDRVRDENVRLKNLLSMHKRLLVLVEKSEKIKDTLAIEKELGRIAEEIERIQMMLKQADSQVRMSTIAIELKKSNPWKQKSYKTPFAWVESVGQRVGYPVAQRSHYTRNWIAYDLPKGFVSWCEHRGETRLISGDDVHLQIRMHNNVKEGGDAMFWTRLIEKQLEVIGVTDRSVSTQAAYRKNTAEVIRGVRKMNGQEYTCSIAVICTKKRIYIVEAWGKEKEIAAYAESIDAFYKTVRVR